ncbi:MAG: NUDIX domain-containing protein [Bacilli bacterium]|nr:NUDIX domain-containing protein [Bacilli bacterium]
MEMIDVFDENNEPLNYSLSRDEVHEKNLWHRHVSCWIINNEGKILLQQRSLSKKRNPGLWSKTGGHVDAGEEVLDAAKREVFEEIGLKVDDDKIIQYSVYKSKDPSKNFYVYNFIFISNLKEEEYVLQKEEVEQVKYFDIEELEQYKKDNNSEFSFSKWEQDDFDYQMELLKEYRTKLKEV